MVQKKAFMWQHEKANDRYLAAFAYHLPTICRQFAGLRPKKTQIKLDFFQKTQRKRDFF